MEDKENILLCKIYKCLKLLDEIDDIISDNPKNQQTIDYELSDYLHIIQYNCEKLDTDAKINIINDIEKARIQREQYNCINIIGKCYNDNKNKLLYRNGRDQLYNSISNLLNTLHQPYKYRIFDENKINSLLSKQNKKEKTTRSRKINIDYDTLKNLLDSGKKIKEIAKQYGCTDAYISILKKKYGLSKSKKGDN